MTSNRAPWRAAGTLVVVWLLLLPHDSGAAGHEGAPTPTPGAQRTVDFSTYRGKVVVVDFWASWCTPCRRSLPWLDAMQRKYADAGLVVIGINEDQAPEDAAAFLEEFPVDFRIVNDPDGEIARAFELIAMPSTYVIARDGTVVARHLGFKTAKESEYEALLQRLLEDSAASSQR
ncbi:MAG TPA: TlpA disulfide reductase family protein [Woeseiaceae bacterium]|nr:TlpA disulfide reductase family protein [Woeseiaceae bacterium]